MATLKLKEENIYATGFIIELPDSRSLLKKDSLIYNPAANKDITYTLKEEDKLWNIAYKYYYDSKWWHVIAEANGIFNPFELPVGVELIIPDLDLIRSSR